LGVNFAVLDFGDWQTLIESERVVALLTLYTVHLLFVLGAEVHGLFRVGVTLFV
jgi:hypothetical protein